MEFGRLNCRQNYAIGQLLPNDKIINTKNNKPPVLCLPRGRFCAKFFPWIFLRTLGFVIRVRTLASPFVLVCVHVVLWSGGHGWTESYHLWHSTGWLRMLGSWSQTHWIRFLLRDFLGQASRFVTSIPRGLTQLEQRIVDSAAHYQPFDPHPLLPSIVYGGSVPQKPFSL